MYLLYLLWAVVNTIQLRTRQAPATSNGVDLELHLPFNSEPTNLLGIQMTWTPSCMQFEHHTANTDHHLHVGPPVPFIPCIASGARLLHLPPFLLWVVGTAIQLISKKPPASSKDLELELHALEHHPANTDHYVHVGRPMPFIPRIASGALLPVYLLHLLWVVVTITQLRTKQPPGSSNDLDTELHAI